MKKLLVLLLLLFAAPCFAGDVTVSWDATNGADSYSVQVSGDLGANWATVSSNIVDTQVTISNVADRGIVLFRVVAVNQQGQVIRTDAGVWYNGSWTLPAQPTNIGVE